MFKDMTNLEENINHYMELKGIKFYTDLLVDIAHELNIKGKDAYAFANREKANFSKMLKGQRPLKYEYIIPLEKIFGMPLARFLNKDAYKLPIEKENIPFDKGFRYYAYLDDPELYEKELGNLLSKTSELCLCETDEFGKTFLDYVVEYNAVNGVRFLHDKYKLKIRFHNNQFDTEPKGMFWVHDKGIELARMISNMNDVELFNDIYDSRYMMASNGFYLPDTIFAMDDFAEIVLDNNDLLESVFETKSYRYLYGRCTQRKLQKEYMDFNSINPEPKVVETTNKRYYLAYGSNLNLQQMSSRCPDAKKVGIAVLRGYRLMFKGSASGNYLTIEKADGYFVPVGVTRAKDKFIFVGDKEAIDKLSGDETNDIKVLSDYIFKNGEIVVPKSDAVISYDFSNDSKNEKDFFDTVKPYFNRRGSKFRIERNVPVKDAIKTIHPDDLKLIGKKEFDVVVQVTMGLMNHQYHTIVVFEIDGGEHIGSKRTANLDRQKEQICKKYGIKLIRIPNSAVKDYESIISLFEFVVKDLPDIEEAYSQMNLFDME